MIKIMLQIEASVWTIISWLRTSLAAVISEENCEQDNTGSLSCDCLHDSIVVESLVVVLTLVSALAVTGENLISFNLITVPRYTKADPNVTSGNKTQESGSIVITENTNVMDILLKVFHYTSLGIAALFFLEIFLRLCTVRKKCFTNPWQICDCVVIVATLSLELVFHFVLFSERTLSFLTYIVLLRLWRLPMVCSIRANEVQEASDCDNELYRSGRLKAEEKCRMLENTILQQAETIRKLERLVQNTTSPKQHDAVISDSLVIKNGHLLNKTPAITDAFITQSETPSACTSERSSLSNLLANPQKQTKSISANEMETAFIVAPEAGIPTSLCKLPSQTSDKLPHQGNIQADTNVCDNKIRAAGGSSKTEDSTKSSSDCVDGTSRPTAQSQTLPYSVDGTSRPTAPSQTLPYLVDGTGKPTAPSQTLPYSLDGTRKPTAPIQTLPYSDNSNISHVPSSQAQIFLRQRKRRSSASELLDYNSMNSSDVDTVFYGSDKTSLCQSLCLEHQKLFSNDVHEPNFGTNNNNSEKSVSTTPDSRDTFISMASEEKPNLQDRKRTRRFASCPEYVYTQRMNISNDESMLIEDEHPTDDHVVFNNLGFNFEENTLLQVVAEYDGTTTYRNEDGIPITSL